jgi:predicted dienelactone hydrolase
MIMRKTVAMLLSLGIALALSLAAPLAVQGSCGYPYSVGYSVTTIAGLRVALWYPTLATPQRYPYNSRFSGVVAKDALPSCGPVPLVVFSHGLGGCGTQSLFFTEELARHGYVVAAPDHHDATFCTVHNTRGSFSNMKPQEPLGEPSAWTDQTYADRMDDLEDLIDALLADPAFAGVIDGNAIGAAGHSLGGYAVLGLGGAWPTWKDPRLKAVLVLSPYIQPFTSHQTLSAMQVPVMYQGAQFDIGETPWLQGTNGAYAQSNEPKYFAELRAASHFVWSNVACTKTSSVQACLALPNPSLIDAYGIAFLDRYLKGQVSPLLAGNGAGLFAWQHAP